MSTTIQHVASEMSSTPRNGQPWNFNALLEVFQIPRTIAADKKLPPGARLLWGVIRQHSFHDGRCTRSDQTLARLLAVSDRQVRRYLNSLESAGLLRSTPRPGKTPIRELLWDSRFTGKIRLGVDTNVRAPGRMCPPPRTLTSPPREGGSTFIGSLKVKSGDDEKTVSQQQPALATNQPAQMMTDAEYIARGRACGFPEHVIQRDLDRLRQRRENPQAERMVKASEVKPPL